MPKFFFTYGTEGYPFYGGWTTVHAKNRTDACHIFRDEHPDRYKGLLNCAFVYDAEEFMKTGMAERGNFGNWNHETLGTSPVK